jgi:AcrR family transcriptional regulator
MPMSDLSIAPAARGRRRDDGIDLRVLDTARSLLTTEGFDKTTIAAIARRSQVAASTIYRRWPSRIELIEEAIFPGFDAVTLTPTGDVRDDIRRFIHAYRQAFTNPAVRAAFPGLLTEYQTRQSARFADGSFATDMRPHFRAMIEAAEPGTIDPAVDPDDLLDILVGTVMYKTLLEPLTPRVGAPDHTADLLDRILRPNTSPDQPQDPWDRG